MSHKMREVSTDDNRKYSFLNIITKAFFGNNRTNENEAGDDACEAAGTGSASERVRYVPVPVRSTNTVCHVSHTAYKYSNSISYIRPGTSA